MDDMTDLPDKIKNILYERLSSTNCTNCRFGNGWYGNHEYSDVRFYCSDFGKCKGWKISGDYANELASEIIEILREGAAE